MLRNALMFPNVSLHIIKVSEPKKMSSSVTIKRSKKTHMTIDTDQWPS